MEKYELRQIVRMDDETKKYEQIVAVEKVNKSDVYLKYVETLDAHKIDVVMRVNSDFIKISRRGIINMNFIFKPEFTTDTFYESPAGKHHFKVFTKSLRTNHHNIEIHYDLYEGESVIGNYYYQLKKVGE